MAIYKNSVQIVNRTFNTSQLNKHIVGRNGEPQRKSLSPSYSASRARASFGPLSTGHRVLAMKIKQD